MEHDLRYITMNTAPRWLRILVWVILLSAAVPDRVWAQDRPNILFLFADDQRADAFGASGNPYIRTPNIDRLSGDGFTFRRAYIMGGNQGAVCAPSRAMLMSGRQLFRVFDQLDTVRTFPQTLRESGYITFGTGKWHQSPASFEKSFSRGKNVFLGGMADHYATPMRDLEANGRLGEPTSKGFSTTRFADAAVEFLEGYAASGEEAPFLAYVSFTAPHDPRTPPSPFDRLYAPQSLPLPPDFLAVHPFHNGWMTGRDEQLAPWPRTTEVIRAQLAEYYGLMSHLDAEIGRILETLHEKGLDRNTIVIYAADNGLSLGSHGLLGKQNLYEHSTHVPLFITGPGIPRGDSDAFVYLYDLFPTITRLASVATPLDLDGQDLSPLWEGARQEIRSSVFTVYENLQRAVRDDRWKLIRYPKLHHTQLFDLEHDPYELNDLAADPDHSEQLLRLTALLEKWQAATGDQLPLTAPTRDSMEFDYSRITRQPDQWQPESVRKKYFGK